MLSMSSVTGSGKKGRSFRVTADLKRKLLLTLAVILVYRVGAYIPVPGIPVVDLASSYGKDSAGFAAINALNMFSGGALSRMSLFALGTMPYVTSQIIMQMLGSVVPAIGDITKDGESGRRTVTRWTRYVTILVSVINAIAYLFMFRGWGINIQASGVPYPVSVAMIVFGMVVGALVVMWLGEVITQHGIGNGVSMLIGINILSGLPSAIATAFSVGEYGSVIAGVTILVAAAIVPLIVLVERGQRRVPITYSKHVSGRSVMGGGSTYLPIKVNTAGVVPIIFASTVLYIPAQLAIFFPDVAWVQSLSVTLSSGWVNWLLSAVLIIFFSYFYAEMVFDTDETAEQIKRAGGFVPGFRPGEATAKYLRHIIDHITLPGAIFMALLAVVPSIVMTFTGSSLASTFGGTSMLILVGVVIDTMGAVETQMQDYQGFFAA